MSSIQVTITATEAVQELLISQLDELGAEGFEQTDTHLVAYFNALHFNSYEVNALLKPYEFTVATLEDQNWNAVWESNFQPVVIEDFCAVRAHFHEPVPGVAHEILITPKMSFGTGHHATTYMMIRQMKDLDFSSRRVFDFGTGTGILAILAEKLGAAAIDAIDIDHWSIENATENAQKNNCTKITLALSTALPDAQYDIILANINRNVILDYLKGLEQILVSGGRILFSGLLVADRDIIVDACQVLGLKLVNQSERNNWISLLFVK